MATGCNSDPLVVPVAELCAIVKPMIDEQTRAHIEARSTTDGHGEPNIILSGPGMVAAQIERDPACVKRTLGLLPERMRDGSYKPRAWVSLSVVDEWLTKLDLTHRLHELTVHANPRWSRRRWEAWAQENGCTDIVYQGA